MKHRSICEIQDNILKSMDLLARPVNRSVLGDGGFASYYLIEKAVTLLEAQGLVVREPEAEVRHNNAVWFSLTAKGHARARALNEGELEPAPLSLSRQFFAVTENRHASRE